MRSARLLSSTQVLFAAAAGPRLGFGHLARCGVLAGALRVRPRVILRGSASTRRDARAIGWQVFRPFSSVLRGLGPHGLDLLIVDDPSTAEVEAWVRRARAEGVAVVSVRDLGASGGGADLTVDGTFVTPRADGTELRGPSFAILDPVIADLRRHPLVRHPHRVLVALGGGAYVRSTGVAIAERLRSAAPYVHVDLAPGFTGGTLPALPAGCRWIEAHTLRRSLAVASVVIVAGGMTLFEAMALGTPAVTLALNEAQHVTTRRAAARGAAIDGGRLDAGAPARLAGEVAALLAAPARAAALATAAQQVVDGRGVARVVQHITALRHRHAGRRGRHAA
ncbi:MAG: hypothetical protein IT184_17505 [Acidobacteria bacterium]|nr:hypothetical protein [Acidobacteriota bacterium]